jgi:GTP diphosphokinase / guanosine-3',5'-bis(diphosphate) 3'-diphosphatase
MMNSPLSPPLDLDMPCPDPCPEQVLVLLAKAGAYLSPDALAKIRRAYELGALAHQGQTRKSGEAYITHPIAVAEILADQRMDGETLCAAILHDALEDTALPRSFIADTFGESVAELVEGVTKLDKIQFTNRQEADAESFRKMMLAMSRDIRVILIKLADRLHNMRTLEAKGADSQRRIALETLEIYAPIAQRLGINVVKAELQDLGFRALYPLRYKIIAKHLASQPVLRREAMATLEARLAQRIAAENIPFRLVSRVKGPWSVYTKMRSEQKKFADVMDVFGFRIVVKKAMQCYQALGAVHSLMKPLEGRFRDFIAIPKANGYQSLHTLLFSPLGSPVEVQIRTEEMDVVAERGIAAHWMYKHRGAASSNAQARAQNWVKGLINSEDFELPSLEFLENVKIDLFPDEVYIFTPKGEILSLPKNATPLDFAYAVHTDVGNHTVAARVDRRLVPIRTKLLSGQTVEIITAPSANPSPQWLEFVVTSKARTSIRHFLKRIEHEDAVNLGHRMLDRALEILETSLDNVSGAQLQKFLDDNRYPRLEVLLADIALGNRMPDQVAKSLQPNQGSLLSVDPVAVSHQEEIKINGSERGVLTFSTCCYPIPGDDIMGYLTAGKGVVVHRIDCPNVIDYRKRPERWVPIAWDRRVEGDFRVEMRFETENKPGALAKVAAAVAECNANIDSVNYRERDDRISVMVFCIEVKDRRHLAEIIRRTRRLDVVYSVERL